MEKIKKIKYKVIDKKIEAPQVVTLELSCSSGLPKYCSGQFIDIYFSDYGTSQGKSYSISSAPCEDTFHITVKAIGEFSNRLFNLEKGDLVIGSLPYGFFYSDLENTHLVMLAGGIGIAPFRAIIMEHLVKDPGRKIYLFYSSRTEDDIIFKDEFDLWRVIYPNLRVKHFITRQKKISSDKQKGRMTAVQVLKEIPVIKDIEFLVCGSIAFVRDMRKDLKEQGIPEEFIYTEAFFSH
jgi:ring-1,2-phenylacetyl-CoA epoxidase subunit PaaE